MATEYGYIRNGKAVFANIDSEPLTKKEAEYVCRKFDATLIAREVSEPRVVSIRA